MGGDGTIGGGSCSVKFSVVDKRGDEHSHKLVDRDAKPGKITVSFPGKRGQKPIEVNLRKGTCVKFKWK